MILSRAVFIVPMLLGGAAFAADTPVATTTTTVTTVTTTAAAPTPVPPAAPAKPITVTANKDQVTPWSGEKIVCTREAPIGSLIAVRHCTTKSESAQTQREARELLSRPIASGGQQ